MSHNADVHPVDVSSAPALAVAAKATAVLALFLLVVLAVPGPSLARTSTLSAEHTYVMGDNDTRREARRMCFIEAKRKLLEQAGTLLEVRTEVREFTLTRDQITSFASAVVLVKTVEERFIVVSGGNFAVHVKVAAQVDMDDVRRRLQQASRDPESWRRMQSRAGKVRELEEHAVALAKRMKTESGDDIAARMELLRVFRSLEDIEADRDEIRFQVDRQTELASTMVQKGMTMDEVRSLAGPPRAEKTGRSAASTYTCHNYGRVWVVYKDGLVACTRKHLIYRERYKSDCHCDGIMFTQ